MFLQYSTSSNDLRIWIMGHSRSLKMTVFDTTYTASCWSAIVLTYSSILYHIQATWHWKYCELNLNLRSLKIIWNGSPKVSLNDRGSQSSLNLDDNRSCFTTLHYLSVSDVVNKSQFSVNTQIWRFQKSTQFQLKFRVNRKA